jgi:uncharacterized protein (TIGR02599 family)
MLLVVSLSVVEHTAATWRRSSGNIEAFQSARVAFDLLTRELSQATLNTYLDYDNATNPARFLRKSELQFVCDAAGTWQLANTPNTPNTGTAVFFQAPVSYTTNTARFGGMEGSLNTCGFYVAFGTNSLLPAHASSRQQYRFRLMNLLVPTEGNRIFDNTNFSASNFGWFTTGSAFPVAENVIALVVHPENPDDEVTGGNTFPALDYNSLSGWMNQPQPVGANQMPPLLQIAMVAIDETSAKRLDSGSVPPAAITDALGKFQSKLAASPSDPSTALADLEADLAAKRINCRIFSSKVPMRESKWTKQ